MRLSPSLTPALGAAALMAVLMGLPATGQAVEVQQTVRGHAQNPQWSTDGKWLAYETNNLANTVELWLVPVSNGAPGAPKPIRIPGVTSNFATGGTMVATPTWMPGANGMVIFEGSNAGGTLRLYYAKPDSAVPNEFINTTQSKGNLTSPAVSQDGKKVAFVSDSTGRGDLYVWTLAEATPKLTFTTDVSEHFPAFGAQGEQVAFSRKNNGDEDLFRWDGGTTTAPIKGGTGDQTRPVYAQGQVVYFTSERGSGQWDIAAVPAAGGERKIVAKNVKLPSRSAPALTPDGAAVVYVSSAPDKADRLMITRLDGSATVEIPTGLVAVGEPDVVSAGGQTLVAFTALPRGDADWRSLHVVNISDKL